MKKLLLLLLVTSKLFSQSNGYNAYLTNISKDTVCINQLVKFTIQIDTGLLKHTTQSISIKDSIGNSAQYIIGGTIQQWIDSNFTMSTQIYPSTLQPGKNKIGVWFGFTNDAHTITQNNCYYNIIAFEIPEKPIKTIYYTLLGEETTNKEGIVIECVFYDSGRIIQRKCVFL